MPTIDALVGGVSANSFELLSEANTYFDERLPLATPWVTSGDTSIRALIMAARVLDSMASPHKTLHTTSTGFQYFLTARQWTGLPASATQRLAWPRLGLTDRNGNPLDLAFSTASVANPTVITTLVAHLRKTGDKIFITGSDTTPTIDGERTITVLTTTTFTIPVNVTVAGTGGHFSWMPGELKDAQSELAGQLIMSDTTLDNTVSVQGITSIKAGSVSLSFKDSIDAHVLPDAVMNLMPPSWFTKQIVTPARLGSFDVIL